MIFAVYISTLHNWYPLKSTADIYIQPPPNTHISPPLDQHPPRNVSELPQPYYDRNARKQDALISWRETDNQQSETNWNFTNETMNNTEMELLVVVAC